MTSLGKLRRAELIALVRRYAGGLDRGRKKGAQIQRIGAALRESLLDRAVSDLLRNPEVVNWRTDAIVRFIFERQGDIGMDVHYAFSSIDRRVRRTLRQYRIANPCQSNAENGAPQPAMPGNSRF